MDAGTFLLVSRVLPPKVSKDGVLYHLKIINEEDILKVSYETEGKQIGFDICEDLLGLEDTVNFLFDNKFMTFNSNMTPIKYGEIYKELYQYFK